MSERSTCVLLRISGKVQGVGFRYSAQSEAVAQGITGWVRNCADGDVELLACGNRLQLSAFRQWLSHGPRFARVASIQESLSQVDASSVREFSIRR